MQQGKQRPLIMGILNVTPDSFSDGGRYFSAQNAIDHGVRMAEEGADIIDIGGESTRPGSDCVDADEEKRRVLPVIEELAKRVEIPISIDTVKSTVAREAIHRGARFINDVSMLRYDTAMAGVAAESEVSIVLMHSRKTPKDMQNDTEYVDVVREVISELKVATTLAIEAGVPRSRIWLDPGIGFAKTASQSIELIARLPELVQTGFPVLVGPSRKSFIGKIDGSEVDDRLGGSAAAVTAAILGGAAAVRVHDVALMRGVVAIAHAVLQSTSPAPDEVRR